MKAVGAMTAIVDLDLLHKPVLRELLTDTVPFLVHPVGICNFFRAHRSMQSIVTD